MSDSTIFGQSPAREEWKDDPIVETALRLLHAEHEQAQRHQRPAWDFPVKYPKLLGAGLTDAVLRRWLEAGLLQQRLDDFILTDEAAHQLRAGARVAEMGLAGSDEARILVPHYDEALRELRYGCRLVKRFRQGAENQELIVIRFQKLGWPRSLEDPLERDPDIDRWTRLRDTIRALNAHQKEARLLFQGDGTGYRVLWRPGTRESNRSP